MRRVLLYLALGIGLVLIGSVAYTASLSPCSGNELPMGLPIGSLGAGYVLTDQGRLYPGQTYRFMNEGPWVGNMTLIAATNTRALVLVRYPADYPTNEVRAVCRDTYP
jgi:hypothetical protein